MVAPPWVILGSVPRVSDDDDEEELVSLAVAEPPRVSIVTVPARIAPDPTTPANYPAFRAAEPSAALLLLFASEGSLAAAAERVMVNESGSPCHHHGSKLPAYFVCDLASDTVSRLPEPDVPVAYQRELGLAAIPPADHFMVADLKLRLRATDHATLLCFWSDTAEWEERTLPLLRYDPLPGERSWSTDGTITHGGRLWWIDLSWGLLTCDPFADRPSLRFLRLPPGKALSCRASNKIDKHRCVKLSAGKFRFVDIDRHAGVAPLLTMWTLLADLAEEEQEEQWVLEYQVSFDQLWADDSCKAAGLSKEGSSDPVLAFVHPTDPDVIYFFLEEQLIGVDMHAKRVLHSDICQLVLPPMKFVSSGFVIACELPPSMSSTPALGGLPEKDTDTSVAEESTSEPSLLSAYGTN